MTRRLLPIIGLTALIWSVPACAEGPTTLSFGCAPWDGQTLDLDLRIPDQHIAVQIWAKGYEDLRLGVRTVVINNKEMSPTEDGTTGRATRQSSMILGSQPSEIELTVHFDELDLRIGGKASGYLEEPRGAKYPFAGIISNSSNCG